MKFYSPEEIVSDIKKTIFLFSDTIAIKDNFDFISRVLYSQLFEPADASDTDEEVRANISEYFSNYCHPKLNIEPSETGYDIYDLDSLNEIARHTDTVITDNIKVLTDRLDMETSLYKLILCNTDKTIMLFKRNLS